MISSLVCFWVLFCLMSVQENPHVPHWYLILTPPTDRLCPRLASTRDLNSIKAESMRAEGGVFLSVSCNTFHLSDSCLFFRDVPVRSDIYRLSLPLHGQHNGERTEIKPDEQHSQDHIRPAEIMHLW